MPSQLDALPTRLCLIMLLHFALGHIVGPKAHWNGENLLMSKSALYRPPPLDLSYHTEVHLPLEAINIPDQDHRTFW